MSRRKRRAPWVLFGLALTAAMPPVQAATSTGTTTPRVLFGLVDGRLQDGTPAQLDQDLTEDASSGVTAVRAQLSWNAVEPSQGVYDWTQFDDIVKAVAAHHMSLLVLVDFTPAWARPDGCRIWTCPPADPHQFASFAATAAARYGSNVAAWEIWNEPNDGRFWAPRADPGAYSQLLELTGAAIRGADPGAYVVSGGLAPVTGVGRSINPVSFLSSVCADGGLAAVDAVGDHPYSYPVPPDYRAPWNAWQEMYATPTSIRSVMEGCGAASKPVWITEYGAPTGGPGMAASPGHYNLLFHPTHVTQALQAEMVTQAVNDVKSYPWAGALFVYSSRDRGTMPTTNENFFGMETYQGSPKPAWSALRAAITGQ